MPDRVGVVEWRRALIASSALPSSARLVALVLAEHMTQAGDRCFPSVALLCHETGLARSTVQEQLALLEQHGWVLRSSRRGTSSTYLAAVPDDVAAPASPLGEGARWSGRWVPDGRAGGARSPGRGCPLTGHEVPTEVPTEQQQQLPARVEDDPAPSPAAVEACDAFERAFGRPARLRREQLARLEGVLDRVGARETVALILRRAASGARPNCLAWFLPALEELTQDTAPPPARIDHGTVDPVALAELWVRRVAWQFDSDDVRLELRARGLAAGDVDRLVALASSLLADHRTGGVAA